MVEKFLVRFNNKKQKLCQDDPGELDVADTSDCNRVCSSPDKLTVQINLDNYLF